MSLDVWLTIDEPVVVVSDEVTTTEVFTVLVLYIQIVGLMLAYEPQDIQIVRKRVS
jgi:hypothetical protein